MRIGTTRPYPPTGLSSQRWLEVPVRLVRFEDLTSTQDGVYLHALLEAADPMSRDRLPHVVAYAGVLYLEDGHTRVARGILRGEPGAEMRVFEHGAEPEAVELGPTSSSAPHLTRRGQP